MNSGCTLVEELVARLQADASVMVQLRQRAARVGARVVLCEAQDLRVAAAAAVLREFSIAQCLLCGEPAAIRESLSEVGADPGRFDLVGPTDSRLDRGAAHLHARRATRGLDEEGARRALDDPLMAGASLVGASMADAMVAGAVRSTPDVLRAGLWCVGLAEGIDLVSAGFLMLPPEGATIGRPLLFADAAVVPEPTDTQLVDIGEASARLWSALFESEPRIACLSFSTLGSADHPAAARMASVAMELARRGRRAEGELQLDAALVQAVAQQKGARGAVAGTGDILLFPDLASANIGYKLAERLGGWRAVGPLVQGFARPVFDLSRGCTAQDVFDTVVVAIASGARE